MGGKELKCLLDRFEQGREGLGCVSFGLKDVAFRDYAWDEGFRKKESKIEEWLNYQTREENKCV